MQSLALVTIAASGVLAGGLSTQVTGRNGNPGAALLAVLSLSPGQSSVPILRQCGGFGSLTKQAFHPISNRKSILSKSGKFFSYFQL